MENTPAQPQVVRFAGFELDLRAGELCKQGLKIKLQEQPLQILAMLLEHPGQVITRAELRSRLWPADTFVDFDHSPNKAVNKLREALGDSADTPCYVETVPKRGYRFIVPVTGVTSRLEMPQVAQTIEPEVQPRVTHYLLPVGGATVAVTLLILLTFNVADLRDRVSPRPATKIRSLAVIPLSNLSDDPAQEYFSDGMTDALITELAQSDSLRVISRTSMMRYKKTNKSLPESPNRLGRQEVSARRGRHRQRHRQSEVPCFDARR